MKQSSMSVTPSSHHALAFVLLLVSHSLLKGAAAALLSSQSSSGSTRDRLAAALLSSQSSSGSTRDHLSAATVRRPVPVSVPSSQRRLLQDTLSSPRWTHRQSDPRTPRANLTLTLGGRLLLSRHAHSENSLSGPPLSRDDTVSTHSVLDHHRGQAERPELATVSIHSVLDHHRRQAKTPELATTPGDGIHSVLDHHRSQAERPELATTPGDRVTSSAVSGRHSRARVSLFTTENQSRRLPPEFLSFPVYRGGELSGRRAGGGGGGGGGREPALESPLADQIITTTAAPRRRETTPRPSPATPAVPVEIILPAPPAGCDAPGGPPARLAARCRALHQLRQQTWQQRRKAAQQQAQQQLQHIIDLHLADVASRARPEALEELRRRKPSPTRGAGTEGHRGIHTPRPSEQSVEDATLLKARRVPPLILTPRTVTKASLSLEKWRQRKPQRTRPVAAALGTGRPERLPVGVSAAGDGLGGDRPETESSIIRHNTREANKPAGRDGGQSRWRTYSSVSPNSIRTAPDKLDELVIKAIDPLSTEPVSLFTTTIVPPGGMPITQKGVIPGLLAIPARVYFSCRHRQPGFYENPQTGCQVYHQCTVDGKKYDYLCGVGTAFNAKTSTCDHWYNISCERN